MQPVVMCMQRFLEHLALGAYFEPFLEDCSVVVITWICNIYSSNSEDTNTSDVDPGPGEPTAALNHVGGTYPADTPTTL